MFWRFSEQKRITTKQCCFYMPQQNSTLEKMNRSLPEMPRSMLQEECAAKEFWVGAIATAAYINNRLTCRGMPSCKTSFELWHDQRPVLRHICIFGCRCFYHVCKDFLKKLCDRARSAVLIGCSSLKNAFKLWDESASTEVVSRNVMFAEESEIDLQNKTGSVGLSTLLENTAYTKPARECHHSSNSYPSNGICDTPCKEEAAELTAQESTDMIYNASSAGQKENNNTEPLRSSSRRHAFPRDW